MSAAPASTVQTVPLGRRLHPLVLVLMPLPGFLAVLISSGATFHLIVVLAMLAICLLARPRFALAFCAILVTGGTMLWIGYLLWMPAEPYGSPSPPLWDGPLSPTRDQAVAAGVGALRLTALTALLIIPGAFIRWRVLGDWLIGRARVSYRIIDVLALGDRLTVLLLADLRTAWHLALLRTRARGMRRVGQLLRSILPVLVAAFRHGDQLALTLDSRGFGALPSRTLHDFAPLRTRDVCALVAAWLLTPAVAIWNG